jgi:putative membrane protein
MNAREAVVLYLKGMAMGAADSVPGVSGGTIAFISGIYDELLASIRAFDVTLPRLLLEQGGIQRAWQHVNGNFLLVLGAGILTSLVLFAGLVVNLLETRYSYLMCFFTGLIAASVWFVGRHLPRWRVREVLLLLSGAVGSILLSIITPFAGLDNALYYFCCGAIAICAMILPGISGAFILLLLGAYRPVLEAVHNLEVGTLAIFLAGCVTGLLGFTRFLTWLLKTHRAPTLSCLLGVLAGSLYTLWPWRIPTGTAKVLPDGHDLFMDVITGAPLQPWLCPVLAAAGFILVFSLEQVGNKSNVKSNSSVP